MPRRGANVPINFRDGPDEEIELTDDQFLGLERTLGKDIKENARAALLQVCNRYIYLRKGEVEGEKLGAAFVILEDLQAAIKSFQHLSNGTVFRGTAVGSLVHWLMRDGLAAAPLLIGPQDIRLATEGEDGQVEWEVPVLPFGAAKLELSDDLLGRLGILLAAAANLAEKALNTRDDAVNIDAFDNWLREMKRWASEHGLPVSYNGPLAKFLFNLNALLPVQYKENVNSSEAMSARLRRATQGAVKVG